MPHVILEFNRKRVSNDEQDLFFPALTGAFNIVNKKIRKHEQVPAVSSRRVCVKSCGKELEADLRRGREADEPKGTVELNHLAATISDSFNGILSPLPGY